MTDQRGALVRALLALLFSLAGAVVVAVLGIRGAVLAVPASAVVPGVSALAGGLILLLQGRRGPPAPFLRWSGAALAVWGTGQVIEGLVALQGSARFPTVGDVVTFAAAPLAVAGALAVPRAARGARPALRLLTDSTLLTVTVTLLVWRLGFSDVLLERGGPPWSVLPAVVAAVAVTCLTFLLAVRDLDRHLGLVALGVAAYTVGELVALHATMPVGGRPPWPAAVLWCLAWPLVALGLLRYRPDPTFRRDVVGRGPADPDARVVLVTTGAGLGVLALGVLALLVRPGEPPGAARTDTVSLGLLLAAVLLLWAREVLNARLRAELLARLHEEATVDPLTALANRTALGARLEAVPPGEDWSLLVVDLDDFKTVNDVLGQAAGDRVLRAVAARLLQTVPDRALVARLSGDEFAVLMPGDVTSAAVASRRIAAAVGAAAEDVEGVHRVAVSASVGVVAVGPRGDAGADPLAALSAAGAALRLAKTDGRGRVEIFDRTAAAVRSRRLVVEERLRRAVAAGDLQVRFQPIVDLREGRVSGVESLARWVDDELGTVDPQEFIPVAEQTGLVVGLGELMLHTSLEQARAAGLPELGVRVSCNVSPLQLRVPGFHRVVEAALAAHRMPASSLVVEVTEAVLVEEGGAGVATLRRLADLGVTIAIDDFGTGYSALGYLRRLPADVLKIDRSLTVSLLEDPSARAIARAVVDLSRSIGLSVVVEGIETRHVADLVARMGVGFGQGSLYGHAQQLATIFPGGAQPPPVAVAGTVSAQREADDPIVVLGG